MIVKINGQAVVPAVEMPAVVEVRNLRNWLKNNKMVVVGSIVGGTLGIGALVAVQMVGPITSLPVQMNITEALPAMASVPLPDNAFGKMIEAYLKIVDYLAWGVFAFSGTSWMFGHRPQAIQLMIGGTAGFLIVLHAWDLVKFLKGMAV